MEPLRCDGLVSRNLLHLKILRQGLQEGFFREAVEILHNSVVVEDLELTLREADGHEEVVLFVAGVGGILRTALGTDTGSGCRTMMAVSDVEGVDRAREELSDATDRRSVGNHPESVAETVLVDEGVLRLVGRDGGDDSAELGVVLEGEEDGLDVGTLDAHVDHPVVFFVLTGELVLLDEPGSIIVSMSA